MSTESSSTAAARPAGRPGRRTAGVAAGAAVVVAGAFGLASTLGAPEAAAGELVPFDSCEALAGWYADLAMADVGPYGLGGETLAIAAQAESGVPAARDTAAGAVAVPEAAGAQLDAGVGTSGTGTNIQEAGVDEPAILKTDGDRVYTVVGRDLVVTDVAGGSVVGRVGLARPGADGGGAGFDGGGMGGGGMPGGEILLAGDRVVVLSTSWTDLATTPGTGAAGDERVAISMMYAPGTPTTVVTTVDVSDPASPTVVSDLEVDGSYLSARAADGTIRLVLTSSPALPFVYPTGDAIGQTAGSDPVGGTEAAAEERNREVIATSTAQDWLPQRITRADDGIVTRDPLLACDQVAHPALGAGLGTLTVLTLDPAAGAVTDTDAVSANGENVYASADRLYVATTAGGWFGRSAEPQTDLHGFDVSASLQTSYVASGTVDGWLMGRWALSEHDGHLRVATTTSSPGADGTVAPATQSSVHVLAEADGALAQVGRLDGLGPGESIRAVRWFGDLAVVVTFEQTDPLYTVDLADPAAPRVTGELKVTGYSAYLHPIGDGRLLGIGQEATLDGMTTGTKAEAYDLRDLAAPVSTGSVVWPDSSSPVEFDSRAFSYLPERSVAVFGIDFHPTFIEPLPLPVPLPEPLPEPLPVPLPEPLPEPGTVPLPSPEAMPEVSTDAAAPAPPQASDPVAAPGTAPALPSPGIPGSYGPAVVTVSVAPDGTVSERGRWSANAATADTVVYPDQWQLEATVVVGDVVAARLVRWSQTDGAPQTRLVLLDLDDLSETGGVTL